MIISVSEVNSILQISGKDDAINSIIPFAESQAVDYTKNSFHIKGQHVDGYSISFSASAKTITNASQSFVVDSYLNPIRFQAGLFIHVQDSIFNDGFFELTDVNENVLTVGNDALFDEAAGAFVKIDLVKFNPGFKLSLARFIGKLLEGTKGNYSSENIGDYSYSRENSQTLLAEFFAGYRKVGVV